MAGRKPGVPTVPKPVTTRLSLYLRYIEGLDRRKVRTVSSEELGRAVSSSAAQVRKDFAYFGQFGRQGVGYPVAQLSDALRRILGTHRTWPAALVGVGNLGSALLSYGGFAERGFDIVLAFDSDRAKVGRVVGGVRVRHASHFAGAVTNAGVPLGIIAVNAASAQRVADMMVAAGIRGILNFAPIELDVPEGVVVNSVDMAVKLEQITYRLNRDA